MGGMHLISKSVLQSLAGFTCRIISDVHNVSVGARRCCISASRFRLLQVHGNSLQVVGRGSWAQPPALRKVTGYLSTLCFTCTDGLKTKNTLKQARNPGLVPCQCPQRTEMMPGPPCHHFANGILGLFFLTIGLCIYLLG